MYRHFHRDWFALAKSVWFWARQKKTKPILFAFCDWIKGSELLVTGYSNNNSIGSLGVWFYAVIHLTPLSNCNRDKMEYNYFQLSPVLFVTVHNVDYTLFTRRPVTDVCVCVTSIELPIFRALTIESNSMGKLKKHLNTSNSFATHANQKQLIFLYSNEFFNFEFLSVCPMDTVHLFVSLWNIEQRILISAFLCGSIGFSSDDWYQILFEWVVN